MFHMSLEKIWLGPTRYIWDNDCQKVGSVRKNDLEVCKARCEEIESCNAIELNAPFCNLRACKSPVPAPPYLPGNRMVKGYYQATGKKQN